jgi:hypothetical protein
MSRSAIGLLFLAALVPVRVHAQAPVHVTVRGTTTSSSTWGDPQGAGVSVDVTATPRVDVRAGYLIGRGAGEAVIACPIRPGGNCITRRVPRQQTAHSVFAALPTRLGQTGPVEWRFVPGLHLDRATRRYGTDPLGEVFAPDARTTWGAEVGLEVRWYATADGRLQLVGNLEGGSVSGIGEGFTDDLSEPNTTFARAALGVRYRLRPR